MSATKQTEDFYARLFSPYDVVVRRSEQPCVFLRTTTMDNYPTQEERIDKVVSWLREALKGCSDITKQLHSVATVCAKWRVNKVKVREALTDVLCEPATEEERLYASDLWFREKVWVPRNYRKMGGV